MFDNFIVDWVVYVAVMFVMFMATYFLIAGGTAFVNWTPVYLPSWHTIRLIAVVSAVMGAIMTATERTM